MKSLGRNQKQLISSQRGIYQLIVAGTQRAEELKAEGIEAMKVNSTAARCRPAPPGLGNSQWLSPSGPKRNRLNAGTGVGWEAALGLAWSFSEVEMCVPRSGGL